MEDVIKFKIYLCSSAKAMDDKEKKKGRQKYKNLNISRAMDDKEKKKRRQKYKNLNISRTTRVVTS